MDRQRRSIGQVTVTAIALPKTGDRDQWRFQGLVGDATLGGFTAALTRSAAGPIEGGLRDAGCAQPAACLADAFQRWVMEHLTAVGADADPASWTACLQAQPADGLVLSSGDSEGVARLKLLALARCQDDRDDSFQPAR